MATVVVSLGHSFDAVMSLRLFLRPAVTAVDTWWWNTSLMCAAARPSNDTFSLGEIRWKSSFHLALFVTFLYVLPLTVWREKEVNTKMIFNSIYQQVYPLISSSMLLPCASLVSMCPLTTKKKPLNIFIQAMLTNKGQSAHLPFGDAIISLIYEIMIGCQCGKARHEINDFRKQLIGLKIIKIQTVSASHKTNIREMGNKWQTDIETVCRYSTVNNRGFNWIS